MNCHNCNNEQHTIQTVKLKTKIGAHVIVDHSVQLPVCDECGDYVIPANVLEAVELRAALIALKELPVNGPVLRFTRKALGLTQKQLAETLGAAPESISRWERGEREMEKWVHNAMLGLVHERLDPPPKGIELREAC